uniref:Protein DGCR14 n=1 Tax=Tetraselmis sp. GSL018 TaxID=582737 RepID=A0A061R578_9CHLO
MAISAQHSKIPDAKAEVQGFGQLRQVVLDEDEYTEKIERIIERDFFPDVPQLQNKLEWLQAVNSANPVLIRQAQMNIAARRAGIPTPMSATPADFATPSATPFQGGAGTPAVDAGGTASARQTMGSFRPPTGLQTPQAGEAANGIARPPLPVPQDDTPRESLNAFLHSHTGEDNASFSEILREENKRRQHKNAWLYEDKNTKLLEQASSAAAGDEQGGALALEAPRREEVSTDGYGTGNAPDGSLIGWKYNPKNSLYYLKDAAPLSSREIAERAQAANKRILHHNTRLSRPSSSSTGIFSPEGQPEASPAPGGEANGGGYAAVATPSMTPGADGMSPLMTWGDIESTPLRLEGEDGTEAGPSFRVPETPSRDLLARKLAAPASSKLRRLSTPGTASPLGLLRRGTGGTPLAPGSGVSKRAGTPLSAAARKLASQVRASTGQTPGRGTDLGLRASYSKPPLRPGTGAQTPWAFSLLGLAPPICPSTRPRGFYGKGLIPRKREITKPLPS